MNNLPKDPPNENNNQPPPFGSNFDPHTNPQDPNNPYQQPFNPTPPQNPTPNPPENLTDLAQSEVAKHQQRDAHGRFIHSEHTASSNSQTTLNIPNPNPSVPPNPPPSPGGLPPIIEINKNTQPSDKKDPPLFGFFITNPVTYLKEFLKRLLKRQAITLKIPVLAIIIIMAGIGGFGIGFQSGLTWALARLFPNYSPILHRSTTLQGTIQKSPKGEYFLQEDNKDKKLWTLKSVSANVNLSDYVGKQVQIKGNLTPTPNLIEVSEVISFDTKPQPTPASPTGGPTSQTPPNTSKTLSEPVLSGVEVVEGPNLPPLYPNLSWEITQTKTLLFTSGRRRIEQEGVYLESSQITDYPQEFINYYTQQLTNLGFKQTFNSQQPQGTTTTFAKEDLFLTFGVKNVYSGSGDNKKLVGYKAFIEHN